MRFAEAVALADDDNSQVCHQVYHCPLERAPIIHISTTLKQCRAADQRTSLATFCLLSACVRASNTGAEQSGGASLTSRGEGAHHQKSVWCLRSETKSTSLALCCSHTYALRPALQTTCATSAKRVCKRTNLAYPMQCCHPIVCAFRTILSPCADAIMVQHFKAHLIVVVTCSRIKTLSSPKQTRTTCSRATATPICRCCRMSCAFFLRMDKRAPSSTTTIRLLK